MEDPKSSFQDFIPEDQDPGPFGEGGFQDWVPAPEPQPQVVEEVPVVEAPKAEPKKDEKGGKK